MSAPDRQGEDRGTKAPVASRRSLFMSFKHAATGLALALKTQRNMRIHFLLTILVIFGAYALHATYIELAVLVLTISAVWVTELLNTAIEAVVDLTSPALHPLAKVAKDVAAGAVLVSAVAAVAVAYLVLFDKIRELLST